MTLRIWLERRRAARMWKKRIRWTWPRKSASDDPIVQAVRRWTKLPSMEPK